MYGKLRRIGSESQREKWQNIFKFYGGKSDEKAEEKSSKKSNRLRLSEYSSVANVKTLFELQDKSLKSAMLTVALKGHGLLPDPVSNIQV